MNSDEPLAFFITWTVYGTHLQGDERGWRLRSHSHQPSQPRLEQWHRTRLKQAIVLLNPKQRLVVETEGNNTAIIEAGDYGPSMLARIMCMPLSPPWELPVSRSATN